MNPLAETGDTPVPDKPVGSGAHELSWGSRTPWSAIVAGALAGFAVTILMSTLGAALGITAGAIGAAQMDVPSERTAEKAATALGIGTGIWMILTAAAVGFAGGWVLNRMAGRDRPFSPMIFGGITWAAGVVLALALVVPAWSGLFTGLGSGVGAGVAARTDRSIAPREVARPMTEEERQKAKEEAEAAARMAAGAAWLALGLQLISLVSTILAAGIHRPEWTRTHPAPRLKTAPG